MPKKRPSITGMLLPQPLLPLPFLELSTQLGTAGEKYKTAAIEILQALSSPAYRAPPERMAISW